MPVERSIIEFIGAADWTDDCRVRVELKKRVTTMTVSEAKAFRTELDAAIAEASRAADGLIHLPARAGFDAEHVGPDCASGKHPCDGGAWDDAVDVEVPCECPCHTEAVAA